MGSKPRAEIATIRRAQDVIFAVQKERDTAQALAERWRLDAAASRMDAAASRERIEELEADVEELGKLHPAEVQAAELMRALEENRATLVALDAQVDRLLKENNELSLRLAELEIDRGDAELARACNAGLEARIVDLEADLDEARGRVRFLESLERCVCDGSDDHAPCAMHGFCHMCETEALGVKLDAARGWARRWKHLAKRWYQDRQRTLEDMRATTEDEQ